MRNVIVVSKKTDWVYDLDDVEVISAKAYLTDDHYAELRGIRVFNLCRSYKYQSYGYYVSLLAEARGHKVCPNITTIQDLKSLSITRVISDDIDDMIQRKFAKLTSEKFTLSIYFGHNVSTIYDKLAKQLYSLFPAPFLRAQFVRKKKWVLQDISMIPITEISEAHQPYAQSFSKEFFNKKRHDGARKNLSIYDLAILVNPEDKEPPSNKKALQHLVDAAENCGFNVELITKEDYSRISYFDALFIRETTSVNHYTYRFARRAHTEGMVVIDDPISIVKCANKVYLSEMLHKARIPTPKTMIVHKDNKDSVIETLGLPCVLKQPDSCLSQGVVKASTEAELSEEIDRFLNTSDLIVCQEFIPTEFDWRIGVLDRTPIFACKYFMAKDHWQICSWADDKIEHEWGEARGIPLADVPDKVIKTAVRAANLVGDGLYGVDLKQVNDKVLVIEINDNPNLDAGHEDYILKDKLYKLVMQSFLRRLELKRQLVVPYPELEKLLLE
ncbi:MAG: RimK family protein [Gammaproteobacteria bacterium]|nr:RimK family protein [Gammaproteobacteria bacterium]